MNVFITLYKSFDRVISKGTISLILTMTFLSLLSFIISLPLLLIIDSVWPGEALNRDFSKLHFFLLATFIAPVVETFIFQYAIIEILRKWIKSTGLIICVSAILFAASHLSSYAYAFANLLNGFVFAFTYIIAKKKNFLPFISTATVHALRNLSAFIIAHIFQ